MYKLIYHQKQGWGMTKNSADILIKKLKSKYPYIENISAVFYEKHYKDAWDTKGTDIYIVVGYISNCTYENNYPLIVSPFIVGIDSDNRI